MVKGTTNTLSLGEALAQKDRESGVSPKRIFLMGCGRSGTWLLTGIMSTFANAAVAGTEHPPGAFRTFKDNPPVQVVKRTHDSCLVVNLIPAEISIIYILRHPYDVLTSKHPGNDHSRHISPLRWNSEMQALRWLCERKRPNTLILRYEDLVTEPDRTQALIAETFGLTVVHPASSFDQTFAPSDKARTAMHGLRAPDRQSIGRWRQDEDNRDYLGRIVPDLMPQLSWVSKNFGYDIELD